ncbi:MAG: hypothetical protein U5R14_01250 [Gemmatimonadota bacterium]|nr:hypothetical protein [Gemmatimonadota bacterium]
MSETTEILCEVAAERLEAMLEGPFRGELVDEALAQGSMGRALKHIRGAMQAHTFETESTRHELRDVVDRLDHRTRSEGFRVLHSWNFRALEFSRENTPVILLDYFSDIGMVEGTEREVLAILLDYYFFHLLILLTMRAWDAEDPAAYMDRVDALIERLQGRDGSGHLFVEHAETLLILGMSQFHPEEAAYDRLVEKVWRLGVEERRVRFARLGTAVLAGHLRWGFGVMYRRDVGRMRDDNVGDYPWLLTAVLELVRAYDRLVERGASEDERDPVVEGMINGLTPDPWAFFERPPAALDGYRNELTEFKRLFGRHQEAILEDLERHRPRPDRYSPLDLHFNFPHNALIAKVLIALHKGSELNLPMDALFRSPLGEDELGNKMTAEFARTLMDYSGVNPEGYDQHGAMFVVYDPKAGLRHFNMARSIIRKNPLDASSTGC